MGCSSWVVILCPVFYMCTQTFKKLFKTTLKPFSIIYKTFKTQNLCHQTFCFPNGLSSFSLCRPNENLYSPEKKLVAAMLNYTEILNYDT